MNRFVITVLLSSTVVLAGCALRHQVNVLQADQEEMKAQVRDLSERMDVVETRTNIRSGCVQVDKPSSGWDDWMQGRRFRKRVMFEPPYAPGTVPKVLIGLNSFDIDNGSRAMLSAEVLTDSTSNTGFTLVFATRSQVSVLLAGACWMAITR